MNLRTATLLAATTATGLAAGAFDLYAHTIMPGLRKTDDRTFVASFQALDRAIINPWFIAGTFFGGLALTAMAAVTSYRQDAFAWVAFGLVTYTIAVVITMAVHVPLNDAIKGAGDPSVTDVATVRAHFHEARWMAWNLVRAVVSTAAFVSLGWALVLAGRAGESL